MRENEGWRERKRLGEKVREGVRALSAQLGEGQKERKRERREERERRRGREGRREGVGHEPKGMKIVSVFEDSYYLAVFGLALYLLLCMCKERQGEWIQAV